jgi:hypothetical protein
LRRCDNASGVAVVFAINLQTNYTMKTKEEILDSYKNEIHRNDTSMVSRHGALLAMEEYTKQKLLQHGIMQAASDGNEQEFIQKGVNTKLNA